MSNLKLPNMSYENLLTLTPENSAWKKIAYATFIDQGSLNPNSVRIMHHESVIAVVSANSVTLDNHGYDSSTTANRLSKIAYDNGIDARIAIRGGEMVVLNPETLKVDHKFYGPETFSRKV